MSFVERSSSLRFKTLTIGNQLFGTLVAVMIRKILSWLIVWGNLFGALGRITKTLRHVYKNPTCIVPLTQVCVVPGIVCGKSLHSNSTYRMYPKGRTVQNVDKI